MLDSISAVITKIDGLVWGWWLIILLLGTHIYMTVRLGFIQRKTISKGIKLSVSKDPDAEGEVSQFGALTTALAATIGTGNIIGVGTAIALGGPGAVLWCWLTGVFGIATKYSESLIAVKYRVKTEDGRMQGGAMYALSRGLNLKWLGMLFAIFAGFASFGIGCATQVNAIATVCNENFGIPMWIVGIIVAILTAIVIFGGIKSIASVCEKLVPFMAIFYVLGCIIILVMNYDYIIPALGVICKLAFTPGAAAGGLVGTGIRMAIQFGVARGLFSNEAGMGSAPNAAASASVSHPAKQGMVQVISVFIDTLLICSATAMMLLLSGVQGEAGVLDGIPFVQKAISANVGTWGIHFITASIFAFAFSSLIGNYYYAESNILFIKNNKVLLFVFRCTCLLAVFLGAQADFSLVWNLADITMGCMAIVNIIAILLLGNIALKVLKDYETQKKDGKNPVFKAENVGIKNTDCWK